MPSGKTLQNTPSAVDFYYKGMIMTNTQAFGWKYMVNWLARREHKIPDITFTARTTHKMKATNEQI